LCAGYQTRVSWTDGPLFHYMPKSVPTVLQKHYNEYGLDKPLVIGEFRESEGASMSITDMYNHAYYYGYSGAWGYVHTQLLAG